MQVMANSFPSEKVPLAFDPTGRTNETNTTLEQKIEIPSSRVESPTKTLENGISPSETIDSALLCAMRDTRERHALLRLEQTMVSFMREETTGYIEVGGVQNSIVKSPSGNIDSNIATNNNTLRQTSFQRCCLHRLADRFGIVRENLPSGMIRLVKVKESCIPSQLLIDLSPADYEESSSQQGVDGLATKLADNANISTTTTTAKPRKMKIMKRSSSGVGSSNSLNKSSSSAEKALSRGRKKLSEKEKAYAEARARIFNEQASSGGGETAAATTTTTTTTSDDVDGKVPVANEAPVLLAPLVEQHITASSSSSSSLPTVNHSESCEDVKIAASKNKATYRNRQQEAADPDFQRLHSSSSLQQQYDAAYVAAPPQQQQFTGYNPHAQQFYPSSSQAAQQYYPPTTSQQQHYAGYAAAMAAEGGEAYYNTTTNPYYARSNSLSRTSSTGSTRADVNNLEEFPSLG